MPSSSDRAAPAAALLLAVVLAGCLPALPAVGADPHAPTFDPAVFFDGRTEGCGTLWVRGQRPADVRVESAGRELPDGTFELRQLIRVGDAPARERTWVFEPMASGPGGGSLTDAAGPVSATVDGATLRIRYPMDGGLVMSQELTLDPGGRLALNLATVRWRGIPVARLREQIRRVGGR